VANISRFSRNTKDAVTIKEEFEDKRVAMAILDMNIDTSTSIGTAMFEVYIAMVSLERRQIADKISKSMKSHAETGKMNPRPPYGYRWVAKKQALEPVPEEQAVIQFIRDLKEKEPEMSCRAVARALNDHPEFPRRGLKEWSVVPVQNIMERHGIPYERRVEKKKEGTTWRPSAEGGSA
jgi:site-specific DNA recombinase